MSSLDLGPQTQRPTSFARVRPVLAALCSGNAFRIGAGLTVFWILAACLWPWILPHDPYETDPFNTFVSPSFEYWFGTDWLGRDVFSRVLAGAGSVLIIAPAAAAISVGGGVAVGLVAGYYRGWTDDILMRFMDALLAFPAIIKAVLVLAVLGTSYVALILVIGIVYIPSVSRVIRAAVITERSNDYVAAARMRGESSAFIMFVELLPNITGPIAVETSVRLGYAVFASTTLSFLGFGVTEPSPDWGITIALGATYIQTAPWIVLFPAFALGSLVIAINLIAEEIRRLIDGGG